MKLSLVTALLFAVASAIAAPATPASPRSPNSGGTVVINYNSLRALVQRDNQILGLLGDQINVLQDAVNDLKSSSSGSAITTLVNQHNSAISALKKAKTALVNARNKATGSL
ncbi:hypothetical protein GGI15_000542 [Coemansia interrupta]|uniref:Uncharacterized protein n=1 Tax=Coemansia interrupta TaxID=1126814 RepID=A0A9W8HS00_9FUNG|nr:hypothetical protein GGI15_000542 [Coemansia interrupta]